MKTLRYLPLLLLMLPGLLDAASKKFRIPDGYKLVFADEFNTDGRPNPDNWQFEQGFVRNKEHQYYQAENAFVEKGHLVIEGRREKKRNPDYEAGGSGWRNRKYIEYSSASLSTQDKHQWQYGIFEVRAKIPTSSGMWPAIWTLGVEGEWPSNGEIDIMEYYQGKILANFAWGGRDRWKPIWAYGRKPLKSFKDPEWADRFHTWRMVWTKDSIKLFVDDLLINDVELSATINQNSRGPSNPFLQPHYLLLNLAIGGNAGGDPSLGTYPSRYLVDYVRIYQKTEG